MLEANSNALTGFRRASAGCGSSKLIVNTNKLTSFPSRSASSRSSRAGNALVELLASVGRLRKLTKLIVYTNKLTSLPESIGELEALEGLDAGSNALVELPASAKGALKELIVYTTS